MKYITGDTHGEFERLGSNYFDAAKGDYVIICGDFGNLWDNSNTEKFGASGYEKSRLRCYLSTATMKISISFQYSAKAFAAVRRSVSFMLVLLCIIQIRTIKLSLSTA